MNDSLECLILRSADYGEADSILTVLTKEYGKIAFFAKGVRRVTSKNARHVQLYSKSCFQFDFKETSTMQRLKSASSINLYRHMKEDLKSSVAAAMIGEAADGLLFENEPVEGCYEMCEKAFEALNHGKDPETVVCCYLASLLQISGHALQVDGCAVCGKETVSGLSVKEGGFVCADCAGKAGLQPTSVEDLKRFRLLVKGGMEHFEIVINHVRAEKSDTETLVQVIRAHAGIPMKAYDLYRRV
ncbi:MAG: DNA repair protein RecO [Bulleidia sp.]